jgi:O-antigen/teichoic acid export membrane protein
MRNALASWQSPQHRDGLALVLSSALSSGVGLLYWVVAARLFDPTTVGVNSTMISTLTLLGSAAQLNLGSALLRFVPVAGRSARSLVVICFAVGTVAAAVTGAVFALGAGLWAPELLDSLGRGPLLAYFALSTPLWSVFVMKDYVLTAIRRATLVPLANLVFSVLKVVLLVAGSLVAFYSAIAVSWSAATAVLVIAIAVWLLRVLPAHGEATAAVAVAIRARTIVGFVSADWAGSLFTLAVNFGLPLVVLARLDADAAATFGVAWAIAFALYLVSNGMGQSLVAHVSSDPGSLDAAYRSMVTKALTLMVPAVIVIVPGAGLILSVFGSHYADTGTALLALSALSAVPNVLTQATVNAARIRQHRIVQFGVPALAALIIIPLSWILMPQMGLTGVGVALLVGQSVVAIVILVGRWISPRRPPLAASGDAAGPDGPGPDLVDAETRPIPVASRSLDVLESPTVRMTSAQPAPRVAPGPPTARPTPDPHLPRPTHE